jgi:hypothetical protein
VSPGACLALLRRAAPWLVGAAALLACWVQVTALRADALAARLALAQEREAGARAIAQFHTDAAQAAAASQASHSAALTTLKANHDRTTSTLRARLAASELRLVALGRELAGLHDAAARAGGPAPASAPAGPPGGETAAAAGPSVADLLEVVDANYAICHRTAAQLVALQDWYEALRTAGRVTRE